VDDADNPVEPSRMREAWLILRTGFARTMRTATEGVEAIKLQKQLFSAAIGTPGLKTPQYLVDKLLRLRVANQLETALKDSLSEINIGARVFELSHFDVGGISPQLMAARAYGWRMEHEPAHPAHTHH